MLIGYARSRFKDLLQPRIDALLAAGVAERRIYSEVVAKEKLPHLQAVEVIRALRRNDILVVPSLADLGTTRAKIMKMIGKLEGRKAGLRVLDDGIDATPEATVQLARLARAMPIAEMRLRADVALVGLRAIRRSHKRGGKRSRITGSSLIAFRIDWFDLEHQTGAGACIAHGYKTPRTGYRKFGPREQHPDETDQHYELRRAGKAPWPPKQKLPLP